MYIETKGYIIMKEDEMNFFDDNCEFCDEIECAKIYEEFNEAMADCQALINEFGANYEVVRYNKTIWLDKVGIKHETETMCTCCPNYEEEGEINE